MRKQLWMFGLLSVLTFMLMVSPSEANFVQCLSGGNPCGAAEGATDEADLINGSPDIDAPIDGLGGDDLIFGNDSPDFIEGDEGDDLIFGGLGSDAIEGNDGNDTLLPGPDTIEYVQFAQGGEGNDNFIVFAGEIVGCLGIAGQEGNDEVNLIGFGPYSATSPFGIDDFELGGILIIDPITGGRIFVEVSPDPEDNTEVINGLPTPNPVFLTNAEIDALVDFDNGTDPCPDILFI